MAITLYTAPDCIRCKIVKTFLNEHKTPYDVVDFKGDADVFNKFYRDNRKAIYRNPEGVEFPLYQDDQVIRQGSGEILAWLLGGPALADCVTRSCMLHGKISGLYPSMCPDDQEENFVEIVRDLTQGGLEAWLETDGRKPALLEKLLAIKGAHVILNIVGSPESTKKIFGGCPTPEELAKTVELVEKSAEGKIRFLVMPLPEGDSWAWPDANEVAAGCKMLADACQKPTLPIVIEPINKEMPWDFRGLEPVDGPYLLKCRAAARRHLFKADIAH